MDQNYSIGDIGKCLLKASNHEQNSKVCSLLTNTVQIQAKPNILNVPTKSSAPKAPVVSNSEAYLKRKNKDFTSENEEKNPNRKKSKSKEDSQERLSRTIFVGNVPISCTDKKISERFRTYGKIESVRFRSFSCTDPNISKKLGFIKKNFHAQ
eukprot:Sdes_comp21062_c0_seq1m19754